MTVAIELAPETEATLTAEARAHGMPLPEYLSHLLEQRADVAAGRAGRSPQQRARSWRLSAGGLRGTTLLSDEAIARETLYSRANEA